MLRLSHLPLFLALAASAGCARLPVEGPLKMNVAVHSLGNSSHNSSIACNPKNERVAHVEGGLRISAPGGGETAPLTDDLPSHLAWSADGTLLAAASATPAGGVVRIFTGEGILERTKTFPGTITALGWSSAREVLVAAVQLTPYAFGGNLRQTLYRWDRKGEPAKSTLTDSTLMLKSVTRWGAALPQLLPASFSPSGDAIMFKRFRDPPAFPPFLQLILYHTETGTERELATTPLSNTATTFAADGDLLLYGARDATTLINPWTEEPMATFPLPGRTLTASPSGTTLVIDGHVFRGGKEVLLLPPDVAACFTPVALAVSYDGALYRLTGISADGEEKNRGNPDQRQKLRKWRAEGLISVQEYGEAMKRINQ